MIIFSLEKDKEVSTADSCIWSLDDNASTTTFTLQQYDPKTYLHLLHTASDVLSRHP